MEPKTATTGQPPLSPAQVRWVKIGIALVGLLGLGLLVYLVVSELREEKQSSRWDEFALIQQQYEPDSPLQDALFEGTGDPYRDRRAQYVAALERFLEKEGVAEDLALAPHVHWLIARLSADQAFSAKEELDAGKRREFWERAIEHVGVIRDRYPDFQTNWRMFAPPGEASLTKRFLYTLESNRNWETEHFPKAREPRDDVVVVLRTNRGDMRMGLYSDEAPELTARFVDRALAGDYDGTAIFARSQTERPDEPENASLRAGHPATRGARPFDRDQHAAFLEREQEQPVLPAPTRWLMPIDRGVVLAWHEPADEYDGPQQLLVVIRRSPALDYRYSPIGKLLDEDSLATADRIFEAETWRDDPAVDTTTDEGRLVADLLRVPVTIVKVLVYGADGALRRPEGPTGPHKAQAEEGELRLDALAKDAYRTEAPSPPVPPAGEGEDEEDPGAEDAEGEGAPDGTPPPDEDETER